MLKVNKSLNKLSVLYSDENNIEDHINLLEEAITFRQLNDFPDI